MHHNKLKIKILLKLIIKALKKVIYCFLLMTILLIMLVYIGDGNIIHSSGNVKIENLEDNKDLYNKLHAVMCTKGLFNE